MKFSSQPQFVRMQGILDALRRGDFPNATNFMKEFHVVRQTILRDLDFMKSEWEAPIQYDESQKGYFLADRTWHKPAVRMERREVFALGIAQKMLGAFRGTPLESDMQSAMAAVADSLKGQVSLRPELLTRHLSVVGEDYAVQNGDLWMNVLSCIDRQEQIRVGYRTFRGDHKTYLVDPYHLAAYHGDWYLLGFHYARSKIASFAVSRIHCVTPTGVTVPDPDEADIQRALDEGFGITGGGEVLTVRLKFSPAVAQYIAGRVWHPSQEIVEKEDGTVELCMETSGWKELVRFVLSWLPDVEVLEPVALRKRVREKVGDWLRLDRGN